MAVLLAYGSPTLGHLYPLGALLGELSQRGHRTHLRTLADEVHTMREVCRASRPLPVGIGWRPTR
jgi:UDP:flavonoid glycosyltransferase YjiC (YdhE family)